MSFSFLARSTATFSFLSGFLGSNQGFVLRETRCCVCRRCAFGHKLADRKRLPLTVIKRGLRR